MSKTTTVVRKMFQGWINYGDYLIGHLLTNRTFAEYENILETCKYAVSKHGVI